MGHVPGGEPDGRPGDPDAWAELYRRAYPRLVAYARRRLATHEQAEEAVSETMARAMGTIDRYRPGPSGVEGWLFGIARNVVLETYRAGARTRPVDPAGLGHQDGGEDPAEAAVAGDERAALRRAFATLSESDRELLELRVLGGLDAAEVGRLTGRRAGAVRQAQSRALVRLRTALESV